MSTNFTFAAVIRKEGQWYVAECPEVGSASQGHTIEEACKRLPKRTWRNSHSKGSLTRS